MTIRNAILAATSASALLGAAHADSLRPIEGPRDIDLGTRSAIA